MIVTVTATTLVVYLVVLLGIGAWAQRRVGDTSDFHLAGRHMGPLVASLSASSSSASAWSLLGVSGAAYSWGLSAVWLVPAVVAGFALNWFCIAPRLQPVSRESQALTLVEFLGRCGDALYERRIRLLGAAVILFCFSFYVASQFQAAGIAIGNAAPVDSTVAIATGAVIVIAYVFLGGFWAASVTDSLQALMMAFVAIVLPSAALAAVGGPAALWQGLGDLGEPGLLRLGNEPGLWLGLVFVVGIFGIGLGYPGQPHVVNRFMALASADRIPLARNVALVWATLIYSGMVVLGWCARVLLPELGNPESAVFEMALELLPAVLGGIISGGVLAAIMSTADSQLLVAGSAASHDMQRGRFSLRADRIAIIAIGLAAILLALFFPESIFNRVLFAWQALGNAFGPLLIVLLLVGPVPPRYRFATVLVGFAATVGLSFMRETPGDALERVLPFFVALGIAIAGHRAQRATNRLDDS